MKNIVLMGAPASGKGTIARILTTKYKIPHISTGKVLGDIANSDSEMSDLLKKYMNSGLLVPDEIVINIIKKRLEEKDCENGYILDGFPRTLEQAKKLDEIIGNTNFKIEYIFNISVDAETLIKRIAFRRVCKNCGASYHLISLKPKVMNVCDVCGGPLFKRNDDDEKTFANRLKIFNKNLKQLLLFYEKKDCLLVNIDGTMDLKDIESSISKIIG